MTRRRAALALPALLLAAHSARAADPYPNRPITLVVQAAAGGGNDALGRRFAEQLQKRIGQPVIVDNRAGGGGSIGSDSASRAAPDGYTLLLLTAGETYYKALNPSVRFDVERDFTPITLLVTSPLVLSVSTAVPVKTVGELVAYAKAHPGALAYGSAGVGSPHNMAGEMFKSAAGIDIVHVPYRGTGLAVQDLLGGQIQLALSSPPVIVPHIQAGKLRALAVADSRRLASMPDVPTLAESGYPTVKFDNWFGIVGPRGLPPAIVDKLNGWLMDAAKDTAFMQSVNELGFESIMAGPKVFGERIHADHERYTRIAEALRMKQ